MVLLTLAVVIQLWGVWEHRKLAKKTGWMLPFALWTAITIGMAIPRVISELISFGFFYPGFARDVHQYTFLINSCLVVWAAKAFTKMLDSWLDHIIKVEHKRLNPLSGPMKVEATVEVTVKEKDNVTP